MITYKKLHYNPTTKDVTLMGTDGKIVTVNEGIFRDTFVKVKNKVGEYIQKGKEVFVKIGDKLFGSNIFTAYLNRGAANILLSKDSLKIADENGLKLDYNESDFYNKIEKQNEEDAEMSTNILVEFAKYFITSFIADKLDINESFNYNNSINEAHTINLSWNNIVKSLNPNSNDLNSDALNKILSIISDNIYSLEKKDSNGNVIKNKEGNPVLDTMRGTKLHVDDGRNGRIKNREELNKERMVTSKGFWKHPQQLIVPGFDIKSRDAILYGGSGYTKDDRLPESTCLVAELKRIMKREEWGIDAIKKFKSRNPLPLVIIGAAGIGKTDIVKELGSFMDDVNFIHLAGSDIGKNDIASPAKLKKITHVKDEEGRWKRDSNNNPIIDRGDEEEYMGTIMGANIPCLNISYDYATDKEEMEKRDRALGKGILFIDEISRVKDAEVLNNLMTLAYDRKIGNYSLGSHWMVIAATNPALLDKSAFNAIKDDKTAGRFENLTMEEAVSRRFRMVNFVPTLDEWLDWAKRSGVDESIISFFEDPTMRYHWFNCFENIHKAGVTENPAMWGGLQTVFNDVKEDEIMDGMMKDGQSFDSADIKTINKLINSIVSYMGVSRSNDVSDIANYVKEYYTIFSPEDYKNMTENNTVSKWINKEKKMTTSDGEEIVLDYSTVYGVMRGRHFMIPIDKFISNVFRNSDFNVPDENADIDEVSEFFGIVDSKSENGIRPSAYSKMMDNFADFFDMFFIKGDKTKKYRTTANQILQSMYLRFINMLNKHYKGSEGLMDNNSDTNKNYINLNFDDSIVYMPISRKLNKIWNDFNGYN